MANLLKMSLFSKNYRLFSMAKPAMDTDLKSYKVVQDLIKDYQTRGFTKADLDCLKLPKVTKVQTLSPPDRLLEEKDFSDKDLNKAFQLPSDTYIGGSEKVLTLREIIKRLNRVYCGTSTVEYMHCKNREQVEWIKKKVESPGSYDISKDERISCLQRMINAGLSESFMAKKWTSEKRFGLEGCDALIPLIKFMIDRASAQGVDTIIIGMPHRGRLNLMTNICMMPLRKVFAQFHGLETEEKGCGDVKYHLGTATKLINKHSKREIKIVVIGNPSHLEAVDGVVLGRTKSEQFFFSKNDTKKVMAVMFHGDAACSGQGVVYEALQFSEIKGYSTGGTIHIVVNNQIGFTAEPRASRSSLNCTDISRIVNAPIFHISVEDPERTVSTAAACLEFRQKFGKDIFVNLIGFRLNGHNEADEPMFTNPVMYKKIKTLLPGWKDYGNRLVKNGTVNEKFIQDYVKEFEAHSTKEFEESLKAKSVALRDWLDSPWKGWFKGKDPMKIGETGVKEDLLKHIGKKFSEMPPGDIKVHEKVEKILKERQELVSKRLADWSLAEAFAFGSLLKEGFQVRLSGLDVERGAFAQRHHVIYNQNDGKKRHVPLKNLWEGQGNYTVCNSPLSQYGIICFETGYSHTDPNALVVWEAQYGDFVNAGQPAIDLFVNSSESKWVRQSGVVLLLPHGLEGMGPDHSSARVERFLQLTDDDPQKVPELTPDVSKRQLKNCNWVVANCTTPSNYFHILMRQMRFPYRKPLVLFTPKIKLLRNPLLRSSFDEMLEGTKFRRIIPESGTASKNAKNVKRLIFCTGKVYYEFKSEREKRNLKEKVAIARIEQLSPVPYDLILIECEKYPNAELYWGQEENKNMGAWSYLRPRFKTLLKGKRKLIYCGRGPSPSPATGSKYYHKKQLKDLYDSAFKKL